MLQWNSMHPYNAVHVARIPGKPDLERLGKAVNRTIEDRGLAGLTVEGDLGGLRTGEPVDCEIAVTQRTVSLADTLTQEIERQLNTPFPLNGPFCPFRFFVAEDEGSFVFGLVYLHAIGDAESIVQLMKEIVSSYSVAAEAINHTPHPIAVIPRPGNPLFTHPGAFARKLATLPRLVRNMGRSWRPRYRDAMDMSNKFRLYRVAPEGLRLVVATARSWGVTVNDLLLAMLMKSCASLAIDREHAKRRTHLSVGCIVNTRQEILPKRRDLFGLFLGSFVLTHPVPNHTPLRELTSDISRMTLDIKRKKLYLATPLELSLGGIMLNLFSSERRRKLYQKHYPLWGGLTNMNVNTLWPAHADGAPVDYIRGVSTGPATPLVISFTTAGEAANIGLSYRSTVFSPNDIERFMGCFLDGLTGPEVKS